MRKHPSVRKSTREKSRLATSTIAFVFLSCALVASRGESLKWTHGQGFRSAPLPVPTQGKSGFTLLPSGTTGITFTNLLSDTNTAENQIRLNGSGVACGDIDADGWCDVYLCGLENGNRLYRNLGGWIFEDITAAAGVACADQYSTGAVFADVDGDGSLDLLVNGLGTGTRLFINDGKGHFHEQPNSGLVRKFGATTMALADVDGDGYLDLYVANYRTTTIRTTGLPLLKVNGQLQVRPQDQEDYELTPKGLIVEHGEADYFYLNDHHGNFRQVPWTNGTFLNEEGQAVMKAPRDWGLSVAFRDLNGDRAPDIYVCNDFMSPDRVWLNDGHGHFRAISPLAIRNISTFSMAVDFADVNRDGFDDIFVADMLDVNHQMRMVEFELTEAGPTGRAGMIDRPQVNRNTLQLNRGDGTYAEEAYYAGIESSGWTWSSIFMDVDLDGYEDLLMSTGYPFDTQDLDASKRIDAMGPMGKNLKYKILMYPRLTLPRMAFRNSGNGRFDDFSHKWGFDDVGVSHGMALADLDSDGDLDVVMNSLNEPTRIYRNETSAPRVLVRLKGTGNNTHGIGAKIIVRNGAVPLQSQEMMCGGRYLSGDDTARVFAAGTVSNLMTIEVLWRGGKNSLVTNVTANQVYEVDESGAVAAQPPMTNAVRALFRDASSLISHQHQDLPFDDFARQPLLPKKLSQLGPGVAWADLNGDGWDDLVIGSGKGGRLSVFQNNGQGGFVALKTPATDRVLSRDQTGILVTEGAGKKIKVLVGSANYEETSSEGANVIELEPLTGELTEVSPRADWSVGPIALGDIDGDGALDLFVGGRIVPGKYPSPASSRLYHNQNGKFILDEANTRLLENVGMVSGALMSDLDGDGYPELILACEWGPLRVFKNEHGRFREVTAEWGLDKNVGWWNGVSVGDFDGDGRLDIVGANWGLNTKYRAEPRHPRKIYYGSFMESGTVDIVEAYFDEKLGKEVPEREFEAISAALPYITAAFPTHRAYGAAGVSELLGVRMTQAREVQVNTLASMVFLNRGNHFEAKPLPSEAQMAPAFAVVVADFDGDGFEDVFLSQNFYDTEPQTSRADAGRGLLLRGNGQGNFQALSGSSSGIAGYGEQRGAAAADYDADGRVDLVVTQNAVETKLYHNEDAKPGLRVALEGPPGNPHGIGAVLRLQSGERLGPVREIHAGSGYWSQDSSVQVLPRLSEPMQLWVRWPGGKTNLISVPAAAQSVSLNPAGELKIVR